MTVGRLKLKLWHPHPAVVGHIYPPEWFSIYWQILGKHLYSLFSVVIVLYINIICLVINILYTIKCLLEYSETYIYVCVCIELTMQTVRF